MSGSTMTISYSEMATRRSRIAEENGAPKWSADAAQKRLASWYSSVMDDEVIRDVASEINDAGAAGADPKIPHVGNVSSNKMPVCMAIALADLEAPVVPYDTAEETMALLELRRTLRISGKIMVGEDPRAMVQAVQRQQCFTYAYLGGNCCKIKGFTPHTDTCWFVVEDPCLKIIITPHLITNLTQLLIISISAF